MNEEERDEIEGIFYDEAPYDFVLHFSNRKPGVVRGLCSYDTKICTLFRADTYLDALFVVLHELAHARIQHRTHSETWEAEFVRLLDKYEYPRNLVTRQAEAMGPNLRRYAGV